MWVFRWNGVEAGVLALMVNLLWLVSKGQRESRGQSKGVLFLEASLGLQVLQHWKAHLPGCASTCRDVRGIGCSLSEWATGQRLCDLF